jgi:hypothetical protein
MKVHVSAMPRKAPKVPGYGNGHGIQTRTKEPHDVLPGLNIDHIRTVVRLPKGAFEPRISGKPKIAIEKGHHRHNSSPGARWRVYAIRLKPVVQVLAQRIRIDQEGHDCKVMERRFRG